MAAEYTPLTGAPVDGPQVEEAMRVYATLNADERQQIFLTLARAIAAYRQTKDIDRLVRFAESIEGMVEVEAQPEFQQARRERAQRGPATGGGVDVSKLIGQLRE